MSRWRRAFALAAIVAAPAGVVAPVVDAERDAAAVMGADGREAARRVYARFLCLREAVGELPAVATYVEPHEQLPEVEWYQRAVEMAFGQMPLVDDVGDAEQQLALVVVEPGTGRCDGVDVQVVPR